MTIKVFNDNTIEQNAYLLVKGKDAIIIDPGFNGEAILEELRVLGVKLTDVLITHGHFDHIRDLVLIGENHNFSIHIHEADASFLKDEEKNCARLFNSHFTLPPTFKVITHRDGDVIEALGERLIVFHTPGHTAGSVCYHLGERLYTGDTLFQDGIGRTDLYSGSLKAIKISLARIRDGFSRATDIYPGHGPNAPLGDILKRIPYLWKLPAS